MNRNCALAPLVLLMLAGPVLNASAQTPAPTKDQLAWNHAWDAYEAMLQRNLGPNDRLMIFEQPLPIDWTTNQGGARKVQSVAAALPGYVFSWSPEAKHAYLHEAYKRFVSDVQIKMPTPAQQAELEAARAEFTRAGAAYQPSVDNYRAAIDKEKARREAGGRVLTYQDIQDIEQEKSYIVHNAWQNLKQAYARLSNAQVPNSTYMETITLMQQAADAAPLSQEGRGVWSYEYDGAALKAVADLTCDPKVEAGWKVIKFDRNTSTQNIRSKGWNAGGKWSGAFFSLGAGGAGSSYENTFTSDSENVSVGLCGGTPIVVKPGVWYSPGFLSEIENGRIPLKPGSSAKLPVFGPNGAIPSVVTGIIVARQVRVSGKLSEEKRSEIKTQSGRGGGFKLGPVRFGGGRGGSSYTYTENKDTGEFLLSSAYQTPVIVAVVLQDTNSTNQPVVSAP